MSLLTVEAFLYDLDGTVIDSYPGIQRAFDNTYRKIYSIENKTSIKESIGPPIDKILKKVTGETDEIKIAEFVEYFKHCYDTEDFKYSVLYAGIKELFEHLNKRGIRMFIVTNKRQKPTELITRYLNIEDYFCALYCIDSKNGYSSKAEMVRDALENEGLSNDTCVLVGDTYQDETAAKSNNINFIYAKYGYGNLVGQTYSITKPLDTLKFINNIQEE